MIKDSIFSQATLTLKLPVSHYGEMYKTIHSYSLMELSISVDQSYADLIQQGLQITW